MEKANMKHKHSEQKYKTKMKTNMKLNMERKEDERR